VETFIAQLDVKVRDMAVTVRINRWRQNPSLRAVAFDNKRLVHQVMIRHGGE
jgi:hypothetical protein